MWLQLRATRAEGSFVPFHMRRFASRTFRSRARQYVFFLLLPVAVPRNDRQRRRWGNQVASLPIKFETKDARTKYASMLGETRREYIVREVSKMETRRFLLRANVIPSEIFVFPCSRPLPADESSDGEAEPAGMLKLGLWLGNKNNDSPRGARSKGERVFASCGSSLALRRQEEHCAQLNYHHLLLSPPSFRHLAVFSDNANATPERTRRNVFIEWSNQLSRCFSMSITAFGQKCRVIDS